ncbi:MAG: adenylyl-sulfate kinase [Pseudomonadales bacterium]|nr:adenylyl-sulfate kinase [Pseudomonadales bacterium]
MSNENIVWHAHNVDKPSRAEHKQQKPCLLWFTGLSGSGKSTIAGALEQKLFAMGHHTYLLDGDNVRHGLNKDLGFSDRDRVENIRRIGEASKLFVDAGLIVLSAFISPFRADRQMVRGLLEQSEFIEVFMDTPLDECERRDPKGLYKKARSGEIRNFTGIDSVYERPEDAEISVNTATHTVDECVEQIVGYLKQHQIITKG